MTTEETWKAIQQHVGTTADGNPGPLTAKAIFKALGLTEPPPSAVHHVKASSFADPADVAAFRKCKANGGSDQQCFKVGDNGIGFRGMDCATDEIAICALPPEDWKEKWGSGDVANGKPVIVTWEGKEVRGIMGDTMPKKENITNGAGIDLNPGFAKEFGVKPPFMLHDVTWRWAE